MNSPFWDPIMAWITGKKEWIPFYVLIISGIFYKYRWQGFWVMAGIGLTIAFADQFASGFCKPFFARPRPCHQPALEGMVHVVGGCGGAYGFISSHAANTFGLAMFLFLLLGKQYRFVSLIFAWAALVSYSRIYVGVHYPADILLGALSGILFGWICYRIYLAGLRWYEAKYRR